MSDQKQNHSLYLRLASAVVLAPLVLFALVYGGWPFLFMAGIAIGISLKEWAGMARLATNPALNSITGACYILIGFGAFVYLRLYEAGGAGLALALMLCIWASDSAAYFSGKTIGGPKMAPKISPNKTWAGFIGGFVGSAGALLLYAFVIGPWLTPFINVNMNILADVSPWVIALLGASITITGQIGDLLISLEKRKVGVKDTGVLIPGHGGLLDRIDSLLMAAPIFLLSLKALGL